MGWLAPLAGALIAAITTAAVVVATTIWTILTLLVTYLAAALMFVYSVAAGVVIGIASGVGLIGTATSVEILGTVGALNAVSVTVWAVSSTYIAALVGAFKTFLAVIHFKTLLALHNIAMLVSADYRKMMRNVYDSIADYSKALNLGAAFIPLALQNARNIVLDCSSMMGRSYDIGEITWVSQLGEWAKKAETIGDRYKNHPGRVFQDLADMIDKPYTDAKSSVVQGMFAAIEKTIDGVASVVNDVVFLKQDLDEFIADLPETLRKHILPYYNKITNRIDDFIANEYEPYMAELRAINDILANELDQHRTELDGIADKMLHPGTMLSAVDDLPDVERKSEERKISEVALRGLGHDQEDREANEDARLEDTYKKAAGKIINVPSASWEMDEHSVPLELDTGAIDPANTPFVGDY